jgi:hypothetical protein
MPKFDPQLVGTPKKTKKKVTQSSINQLLIRNLQYAGRGFSVPLKSTKYQPKQLMGMPKAATILWVFTEKPKLKQVKLHPSVLESETREKFEKAKQIYQKCFVF